MEEQRIISFFNNENKLLKIIGFNDETTYNYLMKRIYKESLNCINCKIYDKGIPLPSNMEVIKIVQESVSSMNLNNLANEDIVLTDNENLNYSVKNAIIQVLQPVLLINENFKNDRIKSNFVIKHIVWLYERLNQFDWSNINNKPIIIAYGEFDRDETYHIELLNLIGVKILYINSSRDVILNKESKIEEEIITFPSVAQIQTFGVRVSNGLDVLNIPNDNNNKEDVVTTWAKQAKDELHKELCSNNGVFRPWQFKNGTTKPIHIDAVIEDIETYWDQEAKFRPGFKADDSIVYVPHFMTKINGNHQDISKYKKLIDFTKNTKITLFKEGVNIIKKTYTNEDMYSLMFTIENDEIVCEKIKKHKLYKLSKINIDVQNFLIKKINEFISLYINKVEMKDILDLIATIITMEDEYSMLIERFDFPFKIPKLIIYLSDRSNFDLRTGLFLNYLNLIGFDIIIYSPTGSSSIEEHMYGNELNVITLDEMNFDLEYSKLTLIKIKEKTSILKKIFNI